MGLTTSLSLSSVQFLLDQSGISSVISDLPNKSTSTQTWPDRGVSEEGTRKLKQISPVRTCLHPMRTPSRMDQLGGLWTPLPLGDFQSRPLSKLSRFKCPSLVQTLPDWCVPAARWTSPPSPARWPGASVSSSASPCCGPASVSPSVWTVSRTSSTNVLTARSSWENITKRVEKDLVKSLIQLQLYNKYLHCSSYILCVKSEV